MRNGKATPKTSVLLDMTLRSPPQINGRFGATNCFNLQGRGVILRSGTHTHSVAHSQHRTTYTIRQQRVNTRKLSVSVFENMALAVLLPEDDFRIETCWRDFNFLKKYGFSKEQCSSLKMILGSKHVGESLNVLMQNILCMSISWCEIKLFKGGL
jgi:hypothetical protein